ncbi:MAG: tryptophanase [Elusimicrobia bacterium]|nr:tryptophanase [Elusimicrobiota bacterium]
MSEWNYRTIIEPFKIKMVEPIAFTNRAERQKLLEGAGYNLFRIPADKVTVDLLTDSGTSAMSALQWSALMKGDESYAGARSFFVFQAVVKRITGFEHIIPTHQGRAAERILFSVAGGKGKIIPGNTHFDTTRANIEATGALAVDLPCAQAKDAQSEYPFKGNIDLKALEKLLKTKRRRIPLVLMTLTNNALGGQPVSMDNLRRVRELTKKYGVPLFIDAARFSENSYFIKTRESGWEGTSVEEIARGIFALADGCLMSAKKDAFANIGGFLALNNEAWAQQSRNLLILTEGFPTYGGLAGRDLEAMAQGLLEVLEEDYLKYRLRSTAYLGEGLMKLGIPIMRPVGGHAVYIDARKFLPHIPRDQFPGQSLVVQLYLEAGIRSCELGSLMFGKAAKMELVRLAIPRRVYTQSHVDWVIEVFDRIRSKRKQFSGYRIVVEPKELRHFTAQLAPAA